MNRYPNLPCLDLGGQNMTPMELCHTVATNRNKFSPKEQADFVRATAKPANERRKNILDMLEKSKVGTDPILQNFGIEKVSDSMTLVPACVINPPVLEYGENKMQMVKYGRWDNINKQFLYTKVGPNSNFKWIFINCVWLDKKYIKQLIDELIKVSSSHNLKIGPPKRVIDVDLNDPRQNNFEPFFSNAERYNLLVITLPTAKSNFYGKYKLE